MEAMSTVSPAQVAEAVSVLYGDPNPMRKAEANAWLTAFSNSGHAWVIAVGLLEAESVEVRYFCANMLLTKVHNEWSHVAPELRSNLTGHLCRILATYMADPMAPSVVVNRICLVLAAVAARASPVSAQAEPSMVFNTAALLENALRAAAAAGRDERGEQTMAVVMALLQAVSEESETLDRARKLPVLAAMKGRREEVLSMLEVCLANHLLNSWQTGRAHESTNHSRLLVPLLQLVHAWLKADNPDSSSLYMTAGELSTTHEPLWRFLLFNLGSAELLASEAAVETVVDLLSVWEHGGGALRSPSAEAAQDAASRMVFQAILTQRVKLAAEAGVQGLVDETPLEEMERGLCRVAVAAAENSTALIASETGACEEALPLAEMMLECAGRGDKTVIEAVVEFYTMLNTVLVANRKGEFRGPLYGRLLQVLLEKAAYPEDFTSWAESIEDEDSFHRFRDQVVADGLETCYNLLQSQYLEYVGAQLEMAATWQQAEAALYSVRCISQSMRGKVLEPVSRRKRASEEEQQAAEVFLSRLFLRLAGDPAGGLFSSHPVLVDSVARLVGTYAQWVAAHPEALEGILSGLLRALQVPSALKQAAYALRSICARCTAHLKEGPLLQRLMEAAEAALPPMPATWPAAAAAGPQYLEERTAVVEGLARVTAASQPDAVLSLTARLASPMIARARHLAGEAGDPSPPSEAQSAALATQLRLLAAAVRFLEVDNPGTNQRARGGVLRSAPAGAIWPAEQLSQVGPASQPASPAGASEAQGKSHPCLVVMEMAWPVLGGILAAPRWRADPGVVEALCAVYTHSLLGAKSAALPLIPSLIPLVGLFEEQQHAACLEVLATAMEICCSSQGEGPKHEVGVFQGALEATCQAAFSLLQRGGLPHCPEVFQSLFEMAYRYLLFLPAQLLASAALPGLFQAAAAVVRHQERDSCKAALAFVGHLVAPGEKILASEPWLKNRQLADACVQQHGEAMAGALLYAAGDTLARDLIRTVAATLYSLISLHPSAAATWLVRALSDPLFPGTLCGAIGDAEMRLFCEIALRQPPLPRPRFEAMMADFANVCRREGTSDLLVAYQM